MECNCEAVNCDKIIRFDYYRDEKFLAKYYDFMSPFIRRKADEMKVNWHSQKCYLKRLPRENENDLEKWNLNLYR